MSVVKSYAKRYLLGMTTNLDTQLLELIEDYKSRKDEPVRTVRRPAGRKVLVERWTLPGGEARYLSLLDFWLASLQGFLEDSGSDKRWFEGLAYQSRFVSLSGAEFVNEYRSLQQCLTLPPPDTISLQEAYLVLDGRITSFMGVTPEGDYWAGTFGPGYYGE
jgi:hypothetical protein